MVHAFSYTRTYVRSHRGKLHKSVMSLQISAFGMSVQLEWQKKFCNYCNLLLQQGKRNSQERLKVDHRPTIFLPLETIISPDKLLLSKFKIKKKRKFSAGLPIELRVSLRKWMILKVANVKGMYVYVTVTKYMSLCTSSSLLGKEGWALPYFGELRWSLFFVFFLFWSGYGGAVLGCTWKYLWNKKNLLQPAVWNGWAGQQRHLGLHTSLMKDLPSLFFFFSSPETPFHQDWLDCVYC